MKLTESKLRSIIREELSLLTEAHYKDNIRSSDGNSLFHAIEDEFGRSPRDIEDIKFKTLSKRYEEVIVYGDDMAQKIQRLADREGIRLDLEVPEYSDDAPYAHAPDPRRGDGW
jgi:hypothetical protein